MSIPLPPSGEQAKSGEPALKVGAVVAAVGALLTLAVSFGFKLTPDQTNAILALATIAAPLVSAWFTRSRVFSPATVAKLFKRDRA